MNNPASPRSFLQNVGLRSLGAIAAGRRVVLRLIVALLTAWVAAPPVQADITATQTSATTVTLNGLQIALDNGTGAILQLSYAGPGNLLDADAAEAGLVDVAYPIEEFEPLHLPPGIPVAR